MYALIKKVIKQTMSAWLPIVFLSITLTFCVYFLKWVESRDGATLNDPILNLFTAMQIDGFIFIFVYASILLGIYEHFWTPMYGKMIEAYAWIVIFRMISLYLAPLQPPEGIIELRDPIVEFFGGYQVVNKDLLFSGHTATCFLFLVASKHRIIRLIQLILLILVAVGVLMQKVHYSIDVFAAPFFAYSAYRFVLWKSSLKMKDIFPKIG